MELLQLQIGSGHHGIIYIIGDLLPDLVFLVDFGFGYSQKKGKYDFVLLIFHQLVLELNELINKLKNQEDLF